MKEYFKLIRGKHYIKNLLIFFPLIFSKQIISWSLFNVIIGFLSFSFMASFIYIINDIKDLEKDKLHPIKCKRPIANGTIKKKNAIITAIIMLLLSLTLNYFASDNYMTFVLLFLYLIINIGYSFGLKNIALLDILLLVIGFIIRVYYGASIIGVGVSEWLYLTVMSASFFLALGKRRNEMIKNTNTRDSLKAYNQQFLNNFMYICLTLTIVFYSLWANAQNIKYLTFTIPLLILIFMKYILIIEGDSQGDPTDILLKDRFLQILIVIFGIIMICFMI